MMTEVSYIESIFLSCGRSLLFRTLNMLEAMAPSNVQVVKEGL
jgi:hypothetical protein